MRNNQLLRLMVLDNKKHYLAVKKYLRYFVK